MNICISLPLYSLHEIRIFFNSNLSFALLHIIIVIIIIIIAKIFLINSYKEPMMDEHPDAYARRRLGKEKRKKEGVGH